MTKSTVTIEDFASGRNNNFDFIRFIAASMVIFSHAYRLATGRGGDEPLVIFSNSQIWFGHLAVIIFFVISGFLIAQSYERSSNIFVFFWARTLRIFPALIASLIFGVFVVGAIATESSLEAYLSDIKTYDYLNSVFLIKIRWTLPGVFENLPYKGIINGSLWTIPHEVVCYVFVAIFGFLGFLKRRSFVLVIAAILFYLRIFGDTIPFVKGVRFIDGEELGLLMEN